MQAKFDGDKLVSVGITCAICHSTVDDSIMKGIGRRLDGWLNRDLDVGAVVALSPDLSFWNLLGVDRATVEKVLRSWGPGKDGNSAPMANAYVANTQMQGNGTFFDPRISAARGFPIGANRVPDRVTPKLPALHYYQLSIPAPTPKPDSYHHDAAARGEALFNGKATCARCHVPPLYTEPGWGMRTPEEIGTDSFQADRSPDKMYRTTPRATSTSD